LTVIPIYGNIKNVKVLGEAILARFAARHAGARAPLQRFLEIARNAEWRHYAAVKNTFRATDLGKKTGRLIFNVGGNKYRLIASVDFGEQLLVVENVLTHGDYERETF
jgi:mRNA interferase HigB